MFDLNTPEGLQQARQSLAQMTTQTAVTVETEQEAAVESVNQEIPPLTEVETESDELRRYEIERTEHWENYYRKHGKGFPIPIVARQDIQRVVWDRVDEDVLEFKRNLYQIIGTDRKPISDTVLVFKNEEDADQIRELGFDTVAAIKKPGAIPFQVATTMLKMKYKRVLLVGDLSSVAFELIHKAIEIGSMYVDEETLQNLDQELNGDPEGYDEKALKKLLKDYINTDVVQACSILRSADAVRENVFNTLSWGVEKIDELDPRTVIQVAMDGLRRIQVLDGRFPAPLTEKSLWGVVGDFVEIAYPTTIACREMLVYQLLPILGVLMGDAYYLPYGSDKHFPATFSLAIGKTSEGKGQAKHHVEDAVQMVDPGWFKKNVHSNPASGEGLVRMLSDLRLNLSSQIRKNRVAIFNSEMVTTFNAAARKDSSLSGFLRGAYDGDRLENFRSDKRNSTAAEDYLLGFCGTITPQELRDVMPAIDWKNGSANRFLWCVGYSDKKLGRSSVRPNFTEWAKRVQKLMTLNLNTEPTAINYSASGMVVWDSWESSLPENGDDLLSESQARIKANCARIAVLYAVLDERRLSGWKPQIEDRHVEAAIEIVTRSRQSVEWYLGQANQVQLVNSTANQDDLIKLKKAVAAASQETGVPELTQQEITKLFTHKTVEERTELCVMAGLRAYTRDRDSKAGKPTTIWTWNSSKGFDTVTEVSA